MPGQSTSGQQSTPAQLPLGLVEKLIHLSFELKETRWQRDVAQRNANNWRRGSKLGQEMVTKSEKKYDDLKQSHEGLVKENEGLVKENQDLKKALEDMLNEKEILEMERKKFQTEKKDLEKRFRDLFARF
ncbi:hypothetical protein FPHYL_9943 [Fusarium phyllophilum]|uniref:Uncharacterized protein n=1 Tax=Fusarium phyllophilum TaxID=47803 RepID=A0A8H5J649_9HYPO|nr:hypothetical protein FPHYL_9943 [Fusarium phyllophilum]